MSYASDTSVSVEKTRAEIESMLMRRGAARFAVMVDTGLAQLAFEYNSKMIRFRLPLPDRRQFLTKKTAYNKIKEVPPDKAHRTWEQACRSRWRGLFLNIKAKLEAVEIGITTFEAEFLAHFVLPSGKTVGEEILPRLDDATKDGKMPLLKMT